MPSNTIRQRLSTPAILYLITVSTQNQDFPGYQGFSLPTLTAVDGIYLALSLPAHVLELWSPSVQIIWERMHDHAMRHHIKLVHSQNLISLDSLHPFPFVCLIHDKESACAAEDFARRMPEVVCILEDNAMGASFPGDPGAMLALRRYVTGCLLQRLQTLIPELDLMAKKPDEKCYPVEDIMVSHMVSAPNLAVLTSLGCVPRVLSMSEFIQERCGENGFWIGDPYIEAVSTSANYISALRDEAMRAAYPEHQSPFPPGVSAVITAPALLRQHHRRIKEGARVHKGVQAVDRLLIRPRS